MTAPLTKGSLGEARGSGDKKTPRGEAGCRVRSGFWLYVGFEFVTVAEVRDHVLVCLLQGGRGEAEADAVGFVEIQDGEDQCVGVGVPFDVLAEVLLLGGGVHVADVVGEVVTPGAEDHEGFAELFFDLPEADGGLLVQVAQLVEEVEGDVFPMGADAFVDPLFVEPDLVACAFRGVVGAGEAGRGAVVVVQLDGLRQEHEAAGVGDAFFEEGAVGSGDGFGHGGSSFVWGGGLALDAVGYGLDVAGGVGLDFAEEGLEGLGQVVAQGLGGRNAGHVVFLADLPFLQLVDQALNVADLQGVFFTKGHGVSPFLFLSGGDFKRLAIPRKAFFSVLFVPNNK